MPLSIYTEHDREIWETELADFVPQRVYDCHIHMFNPDHLPSASGRGWSDVDFKMLRDWSDMLYPGRDTHFLVLGSPAPGIDVKAHNQWALSQVQQDPYSRMNRLVTPECAADDIVKDLSAGAFIGLKPYRLFSVTGDVAQCRIHEFLTHEQMEIANEKSLWVTMHLSRFHGCADQLNLDDLEEYTTRRYPNIRWILAHCARSFTYWPIRQAIERLRDLPNIWYDLSAVTDVRPFITLFTQENLDRVFYGSDGIDSTNFHGQYVALGRAWQGLDTSRFELNFPHCDGRPILAIYEQLLSMKHAAEIAELTTDDLEKIFWRNATCAFKLGSWPVVT